LHKPIYENDSVILISIIIHSCTTSLLVCAESLDELSDLVVGLFGDVANKKVSVPEWPNHPLGPNQLKVPYHTLLICLVTFLLLM